MEAHISNTTQITKKQQKETTEESGISLTIMGQRSIYNSTHTPHRSLNETLGFNHGDHLHRMCNEIGIPEFLELQIQGIHMVFDCHVTCALPAQSYPTRFCQRAHPTYI